MTKPAPTFQINEKACLRGGEMAGQYLDEIGVTDLSKLAPEQWSLFCQKLVGFAFMFAATPPMRSDEIPF